MNGWTDGSWNAVPSLKPSYTCPFPTTTHVLYVFTFSTLISRSLQTLLFSSSLRFGLFTRRVPPSISFCLSSKLESLSSLFVFHRSPRHSPSLTLVTLPLPPSSLRPSVLPPPCHPLASLSSLLSRSLSLAPCLSLTMRFLSCSKIDASLSPFSTFFSFFCSFSSRFSFCLWPGGFSYLYFVRFIMICSSLLKSRSWVLLSRS